MTLLTSLARVAAFSAGRAQPIKMVRHVHLSGRPLVLVALELAGEACAPVAALVGDERDKPRLLVVHEPRSRTQRFEFAAGLADVVLGYLDGYADSYPAGPGAGPDGQAEAVEPLPDAPQFLVPNPRTVAFLRMLGRSTRFRRAEGEHAVPAAVPLLGRWLTHYAQRSEVPASALLLPMTAVLADHWATGQSAAEDASLGALLGWIDPPAGLTGQQAAHAAEDPVRCPPAGPVTDPSFDNEVLEPLVRAVTAATAAGDAAGLARSRSAMDDALRTQLEPTWGLMWRAVDLLAKLPEAAHVERRWRDDRRSFTDQVGWLRQGGAPQPRRDGAVTAARRLSWLEREQQRLAVERAYDDPLVMAEYRMTGEAFAGLVARADPARLDTSGKRAVLRPQVTVATRDTVLVGPGASLRSPARPGQRARVIEVAPGGASEGMTLVVLELKGGMGRSLTPAPGSVPEVGEEVTFTTLSDDFQPAPAFPSKEETPWTHGGPPAEYEPTDEDAREDWS